MTERQAQLSKLGRDLGRTIRTFIEDNVLRRIVRLEDKTANMAAADVMTQLITRITELEKRQANTDNATNAQRRHLENLEKKVGGIINGVR